MNVRMTALACAAVAIATPSIAFAEGDDLPIPGHPGENGNPTAAAATLDPFSLAVPQLDRAEPSPSYGPSAPPKTSDPTAESEGAMEGMDHSNMPGMTDGGN